MRSRGREAGAASGGAVEELLGLRLEFKPAVLVRLVAGDRGDALDEVEHALWLAIFLGKQRLDDFLVSDFEKERFLRKSARLWFPKIRSGRIRPARQNQRMIAFDARDPPLACSVYRRPVQVEASA